MRCMRIVSMYCSSRSRARAISLGRKVDKSGKAAGRLERLHCENVPRGQVGWGPRDDETRKKGN